MERIDLVNHILRLREMVLDSDFMSDDEKSLRIDQLDDLQEMIAYR